AYRHYAKLIPLIIVEGLAGRRVAADIGQPSASRFFIDTARRAGFLAGDLHLIAMHTARFVSPLTLPLVLGHHLGGLLVTVTADLHARIESRSVFHFEFQNEVAVLLIRAQQRVGTALGGHPDQLAVFHVVFGGPVALGPSFEGFSVEDWLQI